MGFDYDKLKDRHEQPNQWASYSDLFMVLSVVFLLLYVTTSLRGGTNSLQNNIEYQQLAKEAEELRQQIKVYETLKEDYLQKGASEQEMDTYNELMTKLTLLQEDAQSESDELFKKAEENQRKKKALSKYQQLVRNIINSNMVAQSRIKKRDTIIEKKDITIQQKQQIISKKKKEIRNLSKVVSQKETAILENNKKIDQINLDLEASVAELQNQKKKYKLSRAKVRRRIAKLKAQSAERVDALKDQNRTVERQLTSVKLKLTSASDLLDKANTEIEAQDRKKKRLQARLSQEKQKAGEIAKRLSEERQVKAQLNAELEKELDEKRKIASRLEKTSKDKGQLEKSLKKKRQELASKKGEIQTLTKEFKAKLAKERAKANARKRLIKDIKKNFKKAGIKAKINERTGEVVLEFGDEYFDTGRARLKKNMRKILSKSVPVYAKSLFQKKEIAKKIANVEVVGFASPTFKGKFVDPESLDPKDQKATSYNLDLSYRRAKSIFDYIFDTRKMKFSEQKRLRKIIKVSGKGYLDLTNEIKSDRKTASATTRKQFCKQVDCQKFQRVIIKFNLKN